MILEAFTNTCTEANPLNLTDPSGRFFIPIVDLLASVALRTILVQLVLPTVIKGTIIAVGIQLFWRPGFTLRNLAIEMITSDRLGPEGVAAAERMYASGNRLISIGSKAIEFIDEVDDWREIGFGALHLAKAIRNAPQHIANVIEVRRLELALVRVDAISTALFEAVHVHAAHITVAVLRTFSVRFVELTNAMLEAEQLFFNVLHKIEEKISQ